MARPLSADERALWRRVTADVTALRAAVADTDVTAGAPPSQSGQPRRSKEAAAAAAQPKPRSVTKTRATLDGRWDRLLRTGMATPDRVIDLHGCTLQMAHARALHGITAASGAGERLIVLVTGKAPSAGTSRLDAPLRGIIRASIVDWLMAHEVASRIAAIRPAHARHGGRGALYIVLRRIA